MEQTNQKNRKKSSFSPLQLTLTGLMTALICVLGPISIPIPISPVPISFTALAIYVSLYVLGMKTGTLSYLIYLLIGLVGVPVFSGFSGGPAKLAGPTGGYLIGFIFMALIAGFFIEKFPRKYYLHAIGMTLGIIICYLFGTIWLCFQMKLTLWAGLMAGAIPYLPADAVKIALALIIGPVLRTAVQEFKRR